MTSIKRIEIVADAVQLPRMIDILKKSGADGWTILRDVVGHGQRGDRDADQPSDVLKNVMILVAADEPTTTKIVAEIRPILKRFGGMCLVSDAQWIVH